MNNFSYWENTTWFNNIDYLVIGAGIVGLNCAINLREKHPKAKIAIIERGILPNGASSKNAGFACFGSLSEIIRDLETHSEDEVIALVKKRVEGLNRLRNLLGDKTLSYQAVGGFELFLKNNKESFEECLNRKDEINYLLKPLFNEDVFNVSSNSFNFKGVLDDCFFNPFEGMIDTGKMMYALYKLAIQKDILFFHQEEVTSFTEGTNKVTINTNNFSVEASKLFIATNGFASQLLQENVRPARAQVLITKPIKNLAIKGTFHLEQGFYYFRNIDSRILLGGGRNLDFKTEETTNFGVTDIIQDKLEELLNRVILPNYNFEIDYKWSGIMGVGKQKKAIVKQVGNNVFCGVRLGGMGIAIGSTVGKELSDLLN